MILVNKKEVPVKDLAKRLGIEIPIDKLIKKPLFEIHSSHIKKDPNNGPGAVKHRQAIDFPPLFRATLSNGDQVEIRFCNSRKPDPKTNGNSEVFEPKVITFDGKAEYLKESLDKAVFYYLHFFCAASPFNNGFPPEYDLVDDVKKADKIIKEMTLRGKAVSHAAALEGDKLLLTAKGMRINIPSDMDISMVKAQLMEYAQNSPAEYLVKAESQVNHIHGLIIDSIDKGVFVLQDHHNVKKWIWGRGVKKNIEICTYPSTVQDDREALITHISEHMNDFVPVLISTIKSLNAEKKAETALENINVFEELNLDTEPADDNDGEGEADDNAKFLPLPDKKTGIWPDYQKYLKEHVGKSRNDLAKALMDGVKSGEINEENIALNIASLKIKANVI